MRVCLQEGIPRFSCLCPGSCEGLYPGLGVFNCSCGTGIILVVCLCNTLVLSAAERTQVKKELYPPRSLELSRIHILGNGVDFGDNFVLGMAVSSRFSNLFGMYVTLILTVLSANSCVLWAPQVILLLQQEFKSGVRPVRRNLYSAHEIDTKRNLFLSADTNLKFQSITFLKSWALHLCGTKQPLVPHGLTSNWRALSSCTQLS